MLDAFSKCYHDVLDEVRRKEPGLVLLPPQNSLFWPEWISLAKLAWADVGLSGERF
jgi:hypothetical protein